MKIQVELFQEQEKTEKGGPTVNHHDRTHLQSQLLLVPSASMRKLSTFYTRVQRSLIKGFNLLFTLVKEDKTLRKKKKRYPCTIKAELNKSFIQSSPPPPPKQSPDSPADGGQCQAFYGMGRGYLDLHRGPRKTWHCRQTHVITAIRGQRGAGGDRIWSPVHLHLIREHIISHIELEGAANITSHRSNSYHSHRVCLEGTFPTGKH